MAERLPALCGLDEVRNCQFDFIIVGGGAAGLVLANRLTENPDISVVVIEAGAANIGDPNILTPALFSSIISNDKYDWMMKTVPQAGHHGKVHQFPRGKSLGGSTAINFMMYARGQEHEYDDWEAMGNPGWGWKDILPYFRKAQHLDDPVTTNIPTKIEYDEANHGRHGPIHTSFASCRIPVENEWYSSATNAAEEAGIPHTRDAFGGSHLGIFNSLQTIDRVEDPGTRSNATTGYFIPIAQRPNLKVLTEALVTNFCIENKEGGVIASGVEFTVDGGKTKHSVTAAREVVSCAGVVKTPQLLELSGIGNSKILEAAGITTVVSSPAVGENLQDHIVTGISYELADEDFSMDRLQNPQDMQVALAEYANNRNGPLTVTIGGVGFMPYAKLAPPSEVRQLAIKARGANQSVKSDFSAKRRDIQIQRLTEESTASFQILLLPANGDCSRGDNQHEFLAPAPPGKVHIAQGIALQFPLSCGTIHIRTNSAMDEPDIDPAYLADPIDVSLLIRGLQFADRIGRSQPLSDRIRRRVLPESQVDLQDDTECEKYLRNSSLTQYHPVGTAAMGEVVDEYLRVKGVRGLRVVDASIIPVHISGNIMSTVYAIAEKAADIIKMQTK